MSNLIKIKIDDMHCTACAMVIDGDLEELKGVKCASTNYAKSVCEIEFDPNQVKIEDIINQIEKSGYKASI